MCWILEPQHYFVAGCVFGVLFLFSFFGIFKIWKIDVLKHLWLEKGRSHIWMILTSHNIILSWLIRIGPSPWSIPMGVLFKSAGVLGYYHINVIMLKSTHSRVIMTLDTWYGDYISQVLRKCTIGWFILYITKHFYFRFIGRHGRL